MTESAPESPPAVKPEPAGEARERRRVLLVTPRLLDTRGGRACADLALCLDRSRFEPAVCCYDGWGPLAEEIGRAGIEIFPLRRRAGLDPAFPLALATEIRRRRIDVVHSLNARRAYLVGALGGLFANVPASVATLRDTRLLSDSRRLAWLGRLCGEMVRAVIATSEDVRDELLHQRWVPPGKTVVIRDGINLARFERREAGGPARAHWGIGAGAPLVGAVLQGRGQEEGALLFEAFARLLREEPRARLLVAGLDLTLARLPEGIASVGAYGDSPAFYAAIDVLCVPIASRSVPLTLLEGLAAGVPVATSRRAQDEGLAPAGPWAFAYLTPPGPARLAEGLLELLRAPEEARALARAGRSCVESEHPIRANVEAVQALYD